MASPARHQPLHESVLAYRGSRYLWAALAVSAAAILAYVLHSPGVPPNSRW